MLVLSKVATLMCVCLDFLGAGVQETRDTGAEEIVVPEHENKTCGSGDFATTCSHNLDIGLSRVQLHGLKMQQITEYVIVRAFGGDRDKSLR